MANNVSIKVTANTSDANKKLQEAGNNISQMSNKAKAAQKNMKEFNSSANAASSAISNLGSALSSGNFSGFIGGLGSAQTGLAGLIGTLQKGEISAIGFGTALKAALGPIGLITGAIAAIGGVLIKSGKDFIDFEQSTAELKSLTGLSDEVMDSLQDKIIETSKDFKASAGEISDSMKMIGSQRPELLSDADALLEVTKAANVLAEAGGMSVEEAAGGITTIMNQMGESADEVNNIINTLAAGQQAGAASVSELKEMFEKAGASAKLAGVDYKQFIALAEALRPSFGTAADAGTSMNNMLIKLASSADNNLNPAIVGIDKALENLANSDLDVAELNQMFGQSGMKSGAAITDAIEQYGELQKAITGTTAAYDQMRINNDTIQGSFDSFKSSISGSLLEIGKLMNEGDGMKNAFQGVIEAAQGLCDIVFNLTKLTIRLVQNFMQMAGVKAVIAILKVAFDVLITVINTIIEISTEVTRVLGIIQQKIQSKLIEPFRGVINVVKEITDAIKEKFVDVINYVTKLWNKFLKWLGAEKEKASEEETDVKVTETKTVKENTQPTKAETPKQTTKSNVETKVQVVPDEGSIKDLEDRLSKLNNELNTKNVSDSRLEEIKKEKSELEKQIETIKIRNGLASEQIETKIVPAEGSLDYISEQISKLETQIKSGVYVDGYSLDRCNSELNEWKKKQEQEEIRVGIKVDPNKNLSIKMPDKNNIIEKGSVEDKMQSLSNANSIAGNVQKMVYEGVIDPEEGQRMIDELNSQLQELGLHPIDLELNTREAEENLKKTQEQMSKIKDSTGAVGSMFGSLGSAIGGTGGEMLKFAGTAIQGIGQIIPQIMTLITAKNAEAIASGTASGASLQFPANIAAIASIVATITSIFSALPSFASGGIIQGSTTLGDYNLARVNGGEMILNTRQQGNLFSMLNSGSSHESSSKSDVNFRISGTNLNGVQKNYKKKMGKLR